MHSALFWIDSSFLDRNSEKKLYNLPRSSITRSLHAAPYHFNQLDQLRKGSVFYLSINCVFWYHIFHKKHSIQLCVVRLEELSSQSTKKTVSSHSRLVTVVTTLYWLWLMSYLNWLAYFLRSYYDKSFTMFIEVKVSLFLNFSKPWVK